MLIGLTGFARSGKDTVAQILADDFGFTRVALADKIRESLYALNPWITPRTTDKDLEHLFDNFPTGTWQLKHVVDKVGWETAKMLPEVRGLMQRYGAEAGRCIFGEDVWIRAAFPDGVSPHANTVVTDVRFENEATWVRGNGGQVVHVQRPGYEASGHSSERGIRMELGDWVLPNHGDLGDLRSVVRASLVAIRQAMTS